MEVVTLVVTQLSFYALSNKSCTMTLSSKEMMYKELERYKGIEPSLPLWKSGVLTITPISHYGFSPYSIKCHFYFAYS